MAHNNSRDRHMERGPPPPIPSPYDPPQNSQQSPYSPVRDSRDWNRLAPPPGHTLSSLAGEPAFGNRFRAENNSWRPLASLPLSHPLNLHVVPQNMDYLHHWNRPPFLRPDMPERSQEQDIQEDPGRPQRMFGTVESMRNCEQAVHQHFEESFRVAQQKGVWRGPSIIDDADKHNRFSTVGPTRTPVLTNTPGKSYEALPSQSRVELQSPRIQTGGVLPLPITPQRRTPLPFALIGDKFVYNHENSLDYLAAEMGREPQPKRTQFVSSSNNTKAIQTPAYLSSPIHRIKVSSPAPPQIYGKPGIPVYNVPSVRSHESLNEVTPLSLTSKVSTRLSEAPPLLSVFTGHQNQTLKTVAHYMFDPSISRSYSATPTPSSQISTGITTSNEYQTQPLDLGGKRKSNSDPINLNFKKVRNEFRTEQGVKRLYYAPSEPISPYKEHMTTARRFSSKLSSSTLNLSKDETKILQLVSQPEKEIVNAYIEQPNLVTIKQLPQAQPFLHPEKFLKNDTNDNLLSKSSINEKDQLKNVDAEPRVLNMNLEPEPQVTKKVADTDTPVDAPRSCSSYSVHKLKKAWLERLTGEEAISYDASGNSTSTYSQVYSPPNSKIPEHGSNVSMDLEGSIRNAASPTSVVPKEPKNIVLLALSDTRDGNANHFENCRIPHMRKKAALRVRNMTSLTNGHDKRPRDHSSSDSEPDKLRQAKRPRPKGKRKPLKERKEKVPGSMSESAKDSDESKGAETTEEKSNPVITNPEVITLAAEFSSPTKKRGRKPREAGDSAVRPVDKKKSNPFKRLSTNVLKKSGESFLQDGPCNEVAPKLGKCRECRWSPSNRSRKQSNIFCRFYAFRKLRYTKNGVIAYAGFSDPSNDPNEEDMSLWLPSSIEQPKLELDMAKFLITQLGDQFCVLIHQEEEALQLNECQYDKPMAWKRVVQGVREMCDVCDATLFNFHWACGKCGFVVCISCYKSRRHGKLKICEEPGKDRDNFQWLLCSNRQGHEDDKLMLTQVIAGDAMTQMMNQLHKTRAKWKIPQECHCEYATQYLSIKRNEDMKVDLNGLKPNLLSEVIETDGNLIVNLEPLRSRPSNNNNDTEDIRKTLAISKGSDSDEDGDGGHSTLRELLIRPSPKKDKDPESPSDKQNRSLMEIHKELILETEMSGSSKICSDSPPISVAKDECEKDFEQSARSNLTHHYKKRPLHVNSISQSSMMGSVPHSWLCDGRLLRLLEPDNQENYKIFQEVWKHGQPAIVSNVSARLNQSLWSPESFSKDFGDLKNDLVNCTTGKPVCNQLVEKFWEGFENISKRLKDENGDIMLLKLKDWPPGEEFAEIMPSRFTDLMAALPLNDYTHRDGRLNLAARLPDNFVKPDLGPKMCAAYGSGVYLGRGTANLHFGISDTVNILVYIGIPKDCDTADHNEAVLNAINESDCDALSTNRITCGGELPGALWHIYKAEDADKIRDLLKKVSLEHGKPLEPHQDPIYDQSCYLDTTLRKRLMEEYDVISYPIVQCMGDAVIIPAGAPHQVRNLQSCIKIAEDFVSPENISRCFHLTEEFRNLSLVNTNHEDKLQIKSIMYHAVKDALSVLSFNQADENFLREDVEIKSVESSINTNNNDIMN